MDRAPTLSHTVLSAGNLNSFRSCSNSGRCPALPASRGVCRPEVYPKMPAFSLLLHGLPARSGSFRWEGVSQQRGDSGGRGAWDASLKGSLDLQQHHPGHRLQGCAQRREFLQLTAGMLRAGCGPLRLCAQHRRANERRHWEVRGSPQHDSCTGPKLLSTGRTLHPSLLHSHHLLNRDSQILTSVCKNHQESLLRIS